MCVRCERVRPRGGEPASVRVRCERVRPGGGVPASVCVRCGMYRTGVTVGTEYGDGHMHTGCYRMRGQRERARARAWDSEDHRNRPRHGYSSSGIAAAHASWITQLRRSPRRPDGTQRNARMRPRGEGAGGMRLNVVRLVVMLWWLSDKAEGVYSFYSRWAFRGLEGVMSALWGARLRLDLLFAASFMMT